MLGKYRMRSGRKARKRSASPFAHAEMALVSGNIVQPRSVGNSASISASILSNSARSTFGGGTGHAGFRIRRWFSEAASFSTSDAGSVSMAASHRSFLGTEVFEQAGEGGLEGVVLLPVREVGD